MNANMKLQKLADDGNWKILREEARKELDEMSPDSERAGEIWKLLCRGMLEGNAINEYDAAFEKYVAGKFSESVKFFAFPHDWGSVPGYGVIINNEFKRGPDRGNAGRDASSSERDRVQVLALMARLVSKAEKEPQEELKGQFFCNMAKLILKGRNSGSSYKLQKLTELDRLPDYDADGCNAYDDDVTTISRPPVNPDGTPVFYGMPESWDKAANDGERLRYAIERARSREADKLWADFLCGQFDFLVAEYQDRQEYYAVPAMKNVLYGLKDNETIADLADGTRKITLPDEFNYIEMYKKAGNHSRLGEIYASRMQFEKAAEEFEKGSRTSYCRKILDSLGTPDEICVSPAGTEFTVPYHFRNAKRVTVKLYRVDTVKAVDAMLKTMELPERKYLNVFDLADYEFEHEGVPDDTFRSLIGKNPEKIISFDLHPLPHHWETTEYLHFGSMAPGAFVAEFTPDDNVSSSVVSMIWAADHALTVNSGIPEGKARLFVNDPATGKPTSDVTVRIHSFYHRYERNGTARGTITPEVLTLKTDANGIAEFSDNDFRPPERSSLAARCILSEASPGKLTLLECPSFGFRRSTMRPNECWRTFIITDKTVYKPGDAIAFTGYLRQPSYGDKTSTYGNKTLTLEFSDPQNRKSFKKEVPFDEATQSFTFEMKLPADAMLGTWHVSIKNVPGSTRFTVEEYKKPEYLLTVTPPEKPVNAGEKMQVSLEAKYYFGAPVQDAEVEYKVFREETVQAIPFVFVWNWLYGERYAICTASYGNEDLHSMNFGRVIVMSGKGRTDAQGKLVLDVDTADAVAKFGEKDFRYTIEAEVRDSTNRTVTSSGSVIAAVKPFYVSIYAPWGFAKTGARQQIEIAALTPNGEKVSGKGILRIFRRAIGKRTKDCRTAAGISERAGEALKTIAFTPGGPDKPEFIINEEGVYELEAEVTSEDGVTVAETATVFVVGEKQGKDLFGEYPISISTDKPVYRPGDTAQILVTCDKPFRTIYFITRSERDAEIQCKTLDGYSKLFSIPVRKDDQPNFFVDVMSYQDGKMLTLQKQIVVPPEKKVLNVTAQVPEDKVRPGTHLPVKIKVTGLDGKPVSGCVTVSVYDKSLEAVHASPVPAILPFFWSWTRHDAMQFRNNFSQRLKQHVGKDWMWWCDLESSFSIPFCNKMERGGRYRNESAIDCMNCAPCGLGEADDAYPEGKLNGETALGGSLQKDATEETTSVRTNFLDRAFWAGRIELPPSGETTVDVPVPDNLTTWVIRVWSLTPDTRVGEARTEIVVSKDVIARLELPRFMVQGDTVNAVVTLNNTTSSDFGEVETILTAPGLIKKVHMQTVTLKANGSVSYEVPLTAKEVGEHTLTLSAKSGRVSDVLELKLPVLVKGMDKQVNSCGRLDEHRTKTVITLDVPEKRRPETTAFALYLSPGAAKNMVELLPYLAADDSGNVFGVVNRFVPAVTAKIALNKLGVRWEDAVPEKTSRDQLYSEYVQRYSSDGTAAPCFKAEDFDRIAAESHRMIRKMVNSDGGWGWFGAYHEQSWPDTTAYVVDALLELNDKEDLSLIRNGTAWLKRYAADRVEKIRRQKEKGVTDTDCLVARVLAKAGEPDVELMKLCYDSRVKSSLAPYSYAMLALAYGNGTDEAKMLMQNLEQFLKVDDENSTAYLDIPTECSFFWYGNENETLSAYLELLLRENPESITAQKVANYLVTNVRNSPWRNSTRSLGAAVRALAKYVSASGEGRPDFVVTVRDGSEEHKYTFNVNNVWSQNGPALFLPADKLKSGKRTLELAFSGTGALYWNGMLSYFSLEDRIEPAGLEMKIRRNYYLLEEDADASALLAGKNGGTVKERTLKYKRIPLKDGDKVKPGDLVEVELVSTAKNDYDYVVFQDAMPSGFEYDKPVSGWMWNWNAPMYAEYRERGAKFYLRNMARGQSTAFYRIRAQLCGTVTALPAKGYGIYARELKCNGAQVTIKTAK